MKRFGSNFHQGTRTKGNWQQESEHMLVSSTSISNAYDSHICKYLGGIRRVLVLGGCGKGLLSSGLRALVSDGVGNDVLVDDLGLNTNHMDLDHSRNLASWYGTLASVRLSQNILPLLGLSGGISLTYAERQRCKATK